MKHQMIRTSTVGYILISKGNRDRLIDLGKQVSEIQYKLRFTVVHEDKYFIKTSMEFEIHILKIIYMYIISY